MTPEQAKKLREPFPKSAIQKLPKGNTQLEYVNHAAVTQRLLEVDPAWTWEPVAFDERGLPATDDKGGLWIRLTVCGVTRYGYGEPQGGQSSDHFDRTKAAISNAIRIAAMRFGVGLDLWSKTDITTSFEIPKPVAGDKEHADWTKRILQAQGFIDLKKIADEIGAYHLDESSRAELIATWSARKEEIDAAGE
ncbi:MAG TPA: hypothetical protein VIG24_19060 [Acidimicrobiia bacterium]